MIRYMLALLVIVPLLGTAQNTIKEENTHHWVTGQRETLPVWVTQSQGRGRYIGISDPCLDLVKGENQALLRAWFLSMIKSGVNVMIMQENYEKIQQVATHDYSSSKFVQVARFNAKGGVKYFKKSRSHTTIFGEYIIEFIEVAKAEDADYVIDNPSNSIIGEYVSYGDEKSVVKGRITSDLDIMAMVNSKAMITKFSLSGTRENVSLTRSLDDYQIQNKESGRFWYSDVIADPNSVVAGEIAYAWRLSNGLWCGVYSSLVYNMVNEPSYAYTMKSVDQAHSSDNQSLIRSTFKGEVQVTYCGFDIIDDKIRGSWIVEKQ